MTSLAVGILIAFATLLYSQTRFSEGRPTWSHFAMLIDFSAPLQSRAITGGLCPGVNLASFKEAGWPFSIQYTNTLYDGCGDGFYLGPLAADAAIFGTIVYCALVLHGKRKAL